MTSEELAQAFHEAYERLAPAFGYETRKASAKPWKDVPAENRRLMIAVCSQMLDTHVQPRPGASSHDALDAAYFERNQLVAALARCYPSGVRRTDIEGWDPEWNGCVFIDLPTGQVSWHFRDREAHLFAGLPAYTKPWDGHDTPTKYARLNALNRAQTSGIAAE